jgi:adenylylsulfate kinase-like enzyme
MKVGICYWITGLSAAGKTTISSELASDIRTLGIPIVILDGDVMRSVLGASAYSRQDRVNLGYQYSKLAQMLTMQGINVVVSVIGLFSELHLWNRINITNYVEVFLDVPLEELQRRDPKGLYKKYQDGDIRNVAGLDLEVDFPKFPDFHFQWSKETSIEHIKGTLLRDFHERKAKSDL